VETDILAGANLRVSRAGAQPQVPAKVEVEEMSEQANVAVPATAGDIMRIPLTTVEQNDHVAAAAYLMKHAGATAVTVLDPRTSEPAGIITEADIAHAVADGKDVNTTRIYELMTASPTVINTTTSVRDAAKVMTSGHFRHLPVVGDAGLVGIVDITDVCRALLEADVMPPPTGTAQSPLVGPGTAEALAGLVLGERDDRLPGRVLVLGVVGARPDTSRPRPLEFVPVAVADHRFGRAGLQPVTGTAPGDVDPPGTRHLVEVDVRVPGTRPKGAAPVSGSGHEPEISRGPVPSRPVRGRRQPG